LCEEKGGKCLVIKSDVRYRQMCFDAVEKCVKEFGGLNILVNNALFKKRRKTLKTSRKKICVARLKQTFSATFLWLKRASAPGKRRRDYQHGSIVGKTGIALLIDYSSSKGAIHSFTKSLALNLGEKGIRVNCVVPGPVWTPNIPGTMPIEEVENFGHEVALKRPGQPEELAPAYVLLASEDGSFMTGSIVDVTGGKLSSDD
jgi:NAD(P)-dependent dehydrogenase (short-subunit alcohol dehydrogenase family)